MKVFIGIDPGKRGGVGVVESSGQFCKFYPCPESPEGMASLLKALKEKYTIVLAVIERAVIINRNGRKQGAKGMLSYGANYGIWLGCLASLNIPYRVLYPQQWQKIIGISFKGKKEGKTLSPKERATAFVLSRWPDGAGIDFTKKKNREKADAICIAEAARVLERETENCSSRKTVVTDADAADTVRAL